MNQTLTENAPSIRLQADMLEEFWVEAVNYVSYLINISSSKLEWKASGPTDPFLGIPMSEL